MRNLGSDTFIINDVKAKPGKVKWQKRLVKKGRDEHHLWLMTPDYHGVLLSTADESHMLAETSCFF